MWRLGSYITQGVYTVSGPFHPFGGAVDMVVVQQEDGSLKSSPWYVKFGKFQGVLKAKERVVDINVNGVDADFHMYLDPRGEAYFLREVDSEEVETVGSSPSSSCGEVNGKPQDKMPVKSKSMNYDFDQCNTVTDVTNGAVLNRSGSKRSRILGFVMGRRSMKEHSLTKEENDTNRSLESAEMAADLLEMRWSTNLSSRSNKNGNVEPRKDNGAITGGRLEGSLVLHEQHFVNNLGSSGADNEVPAFAVEETIVADFVNGAENEVPTMAVEETVVADVVCSANKVVDENRGSEERSKTRLDDTDDPEVGLITAQGSLEIVPESYAESGCNQGDASLEDVSCSSVGVPFCQTETTEIRLPLESNGEFQDVPGNPVLIKQVSDQTSAVHQGDAPLEVVSCSSVMVPFCQNEMNEVKAPLDSNGEFQDVSGNSVSIKQVSEQIVEEQLMFGDLDGSKPSIHKIDEEVNQVESESKGPIKGHDQLTVRTYKDNLKGDFEGVKGSIRRCSSNVEIPTPRCCEITEAEIRRQAKSLPNMRCQFNVSGPENHEDPQFYSPVGKFRSSNWDLLREDASSLRKATLEKRLSQSGDSLSKELKDGGIASGGVDGAGGSWSLWPFRRMGSKNASEKEQNVKKDLDGDTVTETDVEKEDSSPKLDKMHTRALTPTAEQLASLNLAEGKNTVTFTFSTSVLGAQKVDARIYLWRWDTRIVISDVDGTITKSDVLGQFMPLVGRDWSHIGVTHLFSGIKENGYQMLYLSARAISQASITRQFLFNLKQDGKALPDGPVVISPDGLFPSLFREVIRRAPHEFKIACLEDIKSCFPSDRNPFYAGFGNRDTDEFSYLKVGISKGKIFIINPKGEVVINRCIDSKSYASLHALVNGIFPPISVHEEEDYNSWNFWKLPPPTMD
uniref:phosphatidate phosphatase PAH2-like isoform X2 n=1 Tax=Erigeron canadensis TaxID=72917 RepID=UPI001CB90307|nr:phosphatidate phosphatase PAH2-like isoform X2 [Erigeron canadensis]